MASAIVARLLRRGRAHPPSEAAGRARAEHEAGSHRLRLLEIHGAVTLVPPSGEPMPARVLQRGHQELQLLSILRVSTLSAGQLEGMVLEFGIPGGRVRLSGTFEQPEAQQPELFRVTEPRVTEVLQQRAYERVKVERPMYLKRGEGAATIGSYTIDLSGGGCLLDCADELRLNDRVCFELLLSHTTPPVTGTARVVRVDDAVVGRRGMFFESIDDRERERIIEFVGALQEEQTNPD